MPLKKSISKKVVQDIVPSERRSIRNIVIEHEAKPSTEPIHTPRHRALKKGGALKYLLSFIVIFISIIVIGVALSLSYSKAVVTITPKIVNADIAGTFTSRSTAGTLDDLQYQTLTVTEVLTQTLAATKGPLIQTKAKGTAIIYNDYSTTAQTLVAGTRISLTGGLVYRTTTTVSVPGKKTNAGSIAVGIVADQVGEKYNTTLSESKGDFKLLGYKGTPKYDGFYARLKTDVTGGFSGNRMTINPDAKTTKIKAMQEALKATLIAKLQAEVVSNLVHYDGAYLVEFTASEPVMKTDSEAEITVKGSMYGAVFNRDALIRFIAGKEIKKFPSDTYKIDGDKALTFKVSNAKDFSAKKGTPLIFTLTGPITITGTFSETALKEDLRSIKLASSNAVFAKYPAIANAYALLTPFWLRSFPDSTEKIHIEYKY